MKTDSSLFGCKSSMIGDMRLNKLLVCGGDWIRAPDWRFTSECRICEVGPRIAVTSLLRTRSILSNLVDCEAAVAAAALECSS